MKLFYYINVLADRIFNLFAGLSYFPNYFKKKSYLFLSLAIPRFKRNNVNWGDDVSIILVELLSKKKVIPYQFSLVKKEHYLCIGSIIQWYSDKDAIIWGAGLMSSKVNFKLPKKVLAVRGPLTRKCLIERGAECPEVYGDPALLFPRIYNPQIKKKYKLGIIRHFSEVGKVSLTSPNFLDESEILNINISNYGDWTSFIDKILSCETIITSSLHGVIVSDAYNIPNAWVAFSQYRSADSDFKFRDYFLSVDKTQERAIKFENLINKRNIIEQIVLDWEKPTINLTPLIKACPFAHKDVLG